MGARLTTIAAGAGLAVTIFLLGALGPGGAREASGGKEPLIVTPADTFLGLAPAVGALDVTIASLESRLDAVDFVRGSRQ